MVVCKKKEKNSTEIEKASEQCGDRYSYVAIDAVSRLIIAVVCGRRIQATANELLRIVADRIVNVLTILFTTDAWDQYLPAIKMAFGYLWRPRRKANKLGRKKAKKYFLPSNILYGIVKKIKNSRGIVVETIRKVAHGSSQIIEDVLAQSTVSEVLNTSFVEYINGTYRAFCSRLTRKTYKFSKIASNHDAHITIVTSYYNFIKPHCTLSKNNSIGTTPAMEIGIVNYCLTWEELCNFPTLSQC